MRIARQETCVNRVRMIGKLWSGPKAALELTVPEGAIAPWTRENVALWMNDKVGDFESVIDFQTDFSEGVLDWTSDWKLADSEEIYLKCMRVG